MFWLKSTLVKDFNPVMFHFQLKIMLRYDLELLYCYYNIINMLPGSDSVR